MEDNVPGREIIDATQDAVLNAAGSVAEVLENTAHELADHGEVFYQSAEFWVAMSFVVVVLGLARPIGKIVYSLLKRRGEMIAEHIKEVATLKEDAQKLLAQYEKKYRDAELEAQEILNRSEKEISFIKKENMAKLEKDMAIKEKDAKMRLVAAQDKAVQELSSKAALLTIAAVKTALKDNLTESEQDKLIDASIDKIA